MTIARSMLAALALFAFAGSAHAAAIEGKQMTLPSPERQVHVTYFRAPGDAPRPSALLLHGAGGFDRRIGDYNRYASALANSGIDAYLVYYYSTEDETKMDLGADVFENRYTAWARMVDELAEYLENLNSQRQTLERRAVKQAREMLDETSLDHAAGIVLGSRDWHPGVIGIVAGRLVEQYGRPALLIAIREGDAPALGSGRSIFGFPLHEALQACGEHLLSHGGHAAAAEIGRAHV